jgi:hypothetical protein
MRSDLNRVVCFFFLSLPGTRYACGGSDVGGSGRRCWTDGQAVGWVGKKGGVGDYNTYLGRVRQRRVGQAAVGDRSAAGVRQGPRSTKCSSK